jgi:hypothetical protein
MFELDHEVECRHIRQMPFAVGRHQVNQPGGDKRKAQEDGAIEDGTNHRYGDQKIANNGLERVVHVDLALRVSGSGSLLMLGKFCT